MKKLSEFEGDAGMELVAELLPNVEEIVNNPKNQDVRGKSLLNFASTILRNSKSPLKAILAALNEVSVDDYKVTAASIFTDTMAMLNDDALLALFGLQRQNPASSGSASETTEAQNQ